MKKVLVASIVVLLICSFVFAGKTLADTVTFSSDDSGVLTVDIVWGGPVVIRLNGQSFASAVPAVAPNLPAPGTSVQPGQQLPAGVIVVVRSVNHEAKTINVFATVLDANTANQVFGPTADGKTSMDAWWGFRSSDEAASAACQALNDARSASWAQGYQVSGSC